MSQWPSYKIPIISLGLFLIVSNVDNHHSETYWSRAGLLTLDYALFAGWSDEYRRLIYKDSEGFLSESKFGSEDIGIMPSNLFYHIGLGQVFSR